MTDLIGYYSSIFFWKSLSMASVSQIFSSTNSGTSAFKWVICHFIITILSKPNGFSEANLLSCCKSYRQLKFYFHQIKIINICIFQYSNVSLYIHFLQLIILFIHSFFISNFFIIINTCKYVYTLNNLFY